MDEFCLVVGCHHHCRLSFTTVLVVFALCVVSRIYQILGSNRLCLFLACYRDIEWDNGVICKNCGPEKSAYAPSRTNHDQLYHIDYTSAWNHIYRNELPSSRSFQWCVYFWQRTSTAKPSYPTNQIAGRQQNNRSFWPVLLYLGPYMSVPISISIYIYICICLCRPTPTGVFSDNNGNALYWRQQTTPCSSQTVGTNASFPNAFVSTHTKLEFRSRFTLLQWCSSPSCFLGSSGLLST